jgi:hypothetical protein
LRSSFSDVDEEENLNLSTPDVWSIDATKQHVDFYEAVVTLDIYDQKCQKYRLLAIALDNFSWTIAIHVRHWMGNIIASDYPIRLRYHGPKDGEVKLDSELLEDLRRFPDMESIEAWKRIMQTKEGKNPNAPSKNHEWPLVEEVDRWQEFVPEEPQPNWWRKFQKG